MKVTTDTVLVDGRCPGCWKKIGQAHDKDCIIHRKQERPPERPQSEWLQNALKVQREHRASRQPKPLTPALATAEPVTASANGLRPGSRMDDIIKSIYQSARDRYPGRKLQVIVEFPEEAEGEHVWDIRSKYVPVDGEMDCRVQVSRTNKLLGFATYTFKQRVVVEVEFQDAT